MMRGLDRARRSGLIAAVAYALLLAVVGCGGGGAEQASGPAATVQTFYGHLNAARYDAALALYDSDTRAVLSDPNSTGDDGFAGWAKQATKNGTISDVEIVSDSATDDGRVRVEYDVVYGDGTKSRHSVTLSETDEGWRLGFIG